MYAGTRADVLLMEESGTTVWSLKDADNSGVLCACDRITAIISGEDDLLCGEKFRDWFHLSQRNINVQCMVLKVHMQIGQPLEALPLAIGRLIDSSIPVEQFVIRRNTSLTYDARWANRASFLYLDSAAGNFRGIFDT